MLKGSVNDTSGRLRDEGNGSLVGDVGGAARRDDGDSAEGALRG